MTTKAAILTLLAIWGVSLAAPSSVLAQDEEAGMMDEDTPGEQPNPLINRVWTQSNPDLPGVMRIFLSDGTLVQDSCWETHRLSPWKQLSPERIMWTEDSAEIQAEIVSLTDDQLTLKLDLKGGPVEETYVSATVPYLCPDMAK